MNPDFLTLHFSKTLWSGVYRAWVLDAEERQVASLRVLPCLPLSEDEMPPDAPNVGPVILVLVDIAEIDPSEFLNWEDGLSQQLLAKFSHQEPVPRECQFFYPSPMEIHELRK